MKNKIKYLLLIILSILFICLGILVLNKKEIAIDLPVYNFISNFITPKRTNLIIILTFLGSGYTFVFFTLATLIIKNKQYFKYISINLILVTILNIFSKLLFSRSRPIDISLVKESGYSFPSGHSLTSIVFYGFIIYLINKSNINKKLKTLITILLTLLILIIGISRVYLGVHYFTDVLSGFILGIIYLIIFISILNKFKSKTKQ